MNYKELFIHYKTYIIRGAILAVVILIGIVLTLKSTGSNEIIKPNSTSSKVTSDNISNLPDGGEYDYTEAANHIGENATIKGKVLKVFTAKSGVTFFDFCQNYQTCSFSAVIFASDLEKFKDIKSYEREVKIKGLIKSYNGKAEIILNGPEQIE